MILVSDELDIFKNVTKESIIINTLNSQIYKTGNSLNNTMQSIYKTLGLLQILAGLILIASLITCFSKRKKINKQNVGSSSKVNLLDKSNLNRLTIEPNEKDEFNPYSNKDGTINDIFG